MAIVLLDMAMSLDGFIAGTNDEYEGLHDWFFSPADEDRRVVEESIASTGVIIMGRRTFDQGVQMDGFVVNPYKVPHFIISHRSYSRPVKGETKFIFISEGISNTLQEARSVAGEKNIVIAGGANIARQFLRLGLVDEIQLHIAPIIYGEGIPLFDDLPGKVTGLKKIQAVTSPDVLHVRYKFVK
jgi:dihydrofolate reductase